MKEKSIRDILFFFEAWLFLNIAKLMILFFPFKKIAGKIGVPQFETEHENQTNETVVEVQIAVRRGVKFVFFSSKCYDQALASTFMLKRRNIPSTIYFGLNKFDRQLSAHAWVRCNRVIVSGKKGYEKYTPVAWFGTKPK
ncbi:MAG: lasso peptide biosynthesis B2 protein [Chitinophagaceae bacterium]|jgi:hypothetical protein